uniref:Cytochrome c oxidase subunit 2 n=1 Tax=Psoroptes ovis TaxID=83912 RepID=A0A075XDR3_PSOOV|nr:cytochrome c oxidase subunit II [Psoroptes ovis]AIH15199.1 cytochrome c oxidase subunit 2 [Psoroptes ovis]
MPSWLALSFQDSSSPFMMELSTFHDHVVVVMSGVIVLISYIMVFLLFNSKYYKNLSEGTFIETVWSIVPAFLLIVLVLPSMKVLYFMEDIKSPNLSFKVVAHHWYWSYVVPLLKNFSFKVDNSLVSFYEYDSLLEEVNTLDDMTRPRLLGCSSDLVVPMNSVSRLLVSSTDVIHSFTVPSLGVKVDALPGRINQLFLNPSRLGNFYGQCSEICGSNHSFMPISVKVVPLSVYDNFCKSYLLDVLSDNFNLSLKISI